MRICLSVEGSYPYVVGGVSAWIQMLIAGMPEHEFVIYSIGAESGSRGKFSYEIPKNVVQIHENFLDEILNANPPSKVGRFKLSKQQQENLFNLLCSNTDIDLAVLLDIFRHNNSKINFLEIFMSFDFFDVLLQAYKTKYSYLPFTDYFWTIRSMLLPLFFLLQQELPQADIYHSVATGYCGVIGAMASHIFGKPFILTEHGIYSREREEEIIKSNWAKGDFKAVWIHYFYSLAKLSYEKAKRVVTLFDKNAETEISLGCDESKIQIVPNGIVVNKYNTSTPIERSDNIVTIAAILRIVPVKDVLTMIRCFHLVNNELPNVHFWLLGSYAEDPDYYRECQKLVENLQIENLVFWGSVNIINHLPEIDILVLSSISEGQPLAVLEGLAAGKPFVCTDVGCCRELLYGGKNDSIGNAGIIVSVMDFHEMAKAIIYLAQNKEKRLEFAKNGYERVCTFYTYEKMIEQYRKIYADTMSEVNN